ncbi:MAG: FkbM family methyltransferase [Verrucomicrobiota bacterium]|jgi:FkbM family methyltransferase
MKLKEIFYGIGLKPRAREYSFDIVSFQTPSDGEIFYAQWRHPKESRKQLAPSSVAAARKFLRPGDVAIDIGAHTGDSTLPLALAAGPTGAVFALEPNPYVFKILLANVALNRKKTNVYPLMFAATPQDGAFEFEYSDPGFCNGGWHKGISRWRHTHFFKLRIEGKNLAAYLQREFPAESRRVRLIKTDTEGFDRDVVCSLKEMIVQNHPFIRSEIYRHLSPEQRRGFYEDLRALGYCVYKYKGDDDYLGAELSREMMTQWEHFDIFAVPERSVDP